MIYYYRFEYFSHFNTARFLIPNFVHYFNIIRIFSQIRNQLLVIFDVEGVLLDEEYLPILAEKLNKEDEIWEITKQGIQGKINWEEGLRTRVAALKGLDEKVCQEVADNLPIMTGAKEACRILKAAGWKIMAVSGGFTLMMDEKGKLKLKGVDGANDIKLFDVCGLGIAYRAQDLVKDLATTTLEEKDLSKILDIINQHYKLELQTTV